MNHFKQLLSKILSSLVIVSTFSFFFPSPALAAGTATLSLSPATKTSAINTTFAVQVRVNVTGNTSGSTPDRTNAVQANLTYDAAKLEVVGISNAGSAFGIVAEDYYSGGTIRIGRGTSGGAQPVNGNQLVATITFKAKVGSGSTPVTFQNTSQVASSYTNTNILTTKTGGTYSFTGAGTPPVVKPPTVKPPTVSPPTTSSPTPTPTPNPPASGVDSTAPRISNVKVAAQSIKTVTISWKTDEPATTIVEFGFTSKYFQRSENLALTTDHSYTLTYASNGTYLVPGQTYHYKVTSTDKAGNSANSGDKTFVAKGYTVKVKVVDSKGEALKGAKVTIFSDPKTGTTNGDGVVTFDDVSAGKHQITVEFGGKSSSQSIVVVEAADSEINSGKVKTQSFDLKVAGISAQSELYKWIGLGLMAFGIVALAILAILNFRRNRGTPEPNVVQ